MFDPWLLPRPRAPPRTWSTSWGPLHPSGCPRPCSGSRWLWCTGRPWIVGQLLGHTSRWNMVAFATALLLILLSSKTFSVFSYYHCAYLGSKWGEGPWLWLLTLLWLLLLLVSMLLFAHVEIFSFLTAWICIALTYMIQPALLKKIKNVEPTSKTLV